MTTIRAGQLNRRVTIERKSGGVDSIGQPLPEGWETFAQVWANVRHQSGSESIKADTVTSEVKASIRIRYRADIDAGMRVVLGARTYEIRAVLPDEAGRKYVDLVCEVVG